MEVILLTLGEAADGESAAIGNGVVVRGQPDQAGVVPVVINLQADTHSSISVLVVNYRMFDGL